MEFQVACAVTMELKIFVSRVGWSNTAGSIAVHTSGDGQCSSSFHHIILPHNLSSRSVHNTRIERLWFDVTSGFGGKWKTFFLELEQTCGLDADRTEHIWLLHHLFLAAINQDALQWAEAWNAHRLHARGTRAASPREMFMFGMATDGPRGFDLPHNADPDDLASYGIDWAALANPVLMRHHREDNPGARADDPPFTATSQPSHLSHVPCEPPHCPLPPAQVAMLDQHLAAHFDLSSRDMLVRRNLWSSALEYCSRISNVYARVPM